MREREARALAASVAAAEAERGRLTTELARRAQDLADARAAHADLRACTPEWTSDDYDVLANNCHHWAEAALGVLGVAAPIPPWVDRSTRWMRFFSGVAVGTEERGGGGAVERAPLLPRG